MRGRGAPLLRAPVPAGAGDLGPGDAADAVHARQHYELVHHSRGNRDLNYRRFFAVTTLAGVRVEDPAVFDATHDRSPDWVADGVVGLRIDHPDGLVDPAEYLDRLGALAPDAWITVEKILEPGEELPDGRSPAPPATTRCARSTASSSTGCRAGVDRALPAADR